ncbi:uncharacterized protein LOC119161449 isoform X2 [Rhipicephalus microplus]|uniref:uncharacterized protein LOC119161449 isoform X2 n=1 Tax=Rhipicephalus microplus TaxID=6941 RepID=UPI003F6A8F7F
MLGRRRCGEKHPVAAILALLSLSCIVGTAAQIDKSNRELNDSANRIPWPVYQHSTASSALGLNQNRPQEDTKPRPRLSDSLLPPSFIKVINSVSSPDWETTTPAGPRAIFLTSSTTTTTTTTTTPSPPPPSPPPPPSTTAAALTSSTYIKRGHPPEVDPLSPSAWKAVPESPPFPKRSRLPAKRRRKLRPKQESTVKEHTLFTTEQATEASTTAHPTRKFGVTRRQLPPLVRGYRSKPTKSTPPTTTPPRRAYVRPALPGRKYTPAIPRRPVLATTTSTTSSSTSSSTTTTTTSTRRPFIFGERKVPSWYGQTSTSTTTTSTTRPLLSTPLARLGRRPSGLRYKPDDLSPGFGPRTKLSLRPLPPVIRDAVPQTVEKDELELSQSVQRPNGRRRLVNDVPARVHLVKGQLPDLPTPQITHNETEAIKPEGRQSGSDEGGEVVRFVAIPHFVDGNIPTKRADFKESSRVPFRRIFRNPFVVPVRRRFPYAGPVAVFPPSLSSVEDSSSQDEEVIRIPVERPESGAFPALQPPPALPLRVVRPAYPGAVGHQASAAMAPVPPTNNAEHESAFTQPRPPMTLGSANLPSRVSRPKPEEPRCDRFSEDICLDDFEYPTAAILDTISRQRSRFDTMYAEVRDRSPQVDGVTRKQEERYTMRHYFGGSERDGRPRDYAPDGGFLCPSEILYERPRRARNHLGVWKVIVNIGEYRQTMRLEKCLRPNRPCSYVLEKYQSSCSQVYSYQRLLTFEKGKGLHIDIFRVPSSCSCHVKGFIPFQRHDEPVTPVRQQPPFEYDRTAYTSATSLAAAKEPDNGGGRGNNTLWIILGNGKDLDPETKARLLQQLRQYPQLAEQLSQGENVRELGNEADEYQRPYTRTEPTRTPGYGVHHYGSTHKTREERPQLLNAAPPRWSQSTVANEPFKYVQPNRIRRPPPQPQTPTDYEADDALPPGARPRYYQKPFKASEEDALFTRYHEPARERHPHVGQASQGSADVRLAHGPTAAPRGDVLLVEPVRQRPYGKRFQVVTTTEPSTTRDVAKKINYSYHPIIDYITR